MSHGARALAVARERLQAVPAAVPVPGDRPAARVPTCPGPRHARARGAERCSLPPAESARRRPRGPSARLGNGCAATRAPAAARPGGARPESRPVRGSGLACGRRAAARRLLRPRGSAPARTGGPGAARRGRAGVGVAAARVRRSGRPHGPGRCHDPGGRLQDRQRAPADRRGAGAVPDEVLRAGAAHPARRAAERAAAAVPDRPRGPALHPGRGPAARRPHPEAIWAAIRTAGSTGDFRPNPGPSCGWCGYKPLCPAWDGVPPPYPGWPEPAVSPSRSS
jgi:hypothetical protein